MTLLRCTLYYSGTAGAAMLSATWLRGWRERVRGVIGREGGAVLLAAPAGIHTFGVRAGLGVWLLGRNGSVLVVYEQVAPRRVLYRPSMRWVVEVPPGTDAPLLGQQLRCRVQSAQVAPPW